MEKSQVMGIESRRSVIGKFLLLRRPWSIVKSSGLLKTWGFIREVGLPHRSILILLSA